MAFIFYGEDAFVFRLGCPSTSTPHFCNDIRINS